MNCLLRTSKISSLAVLAALGLISSGCVTTPARDDSTPPPPASMADKIGQSVKSGVDKTASLVGITPNRHAGQDSEIVQVAARSEEPSPDLLVSLAQMHERGGRLADAEKQYQRVLKTAPNYLPALLGYAHLNCERGNFDAAIKLYQKAVTTYPKDATPYNDLGICYHKRGMIAEAAKALKQAVQLEPQRKLYRNNLARVLVDMGHVDEALVHLTAAHGAAIAHYNVGYLLNQKGDRQGALIQFHQALHKDPSLAAAQDWINRLSAADPRAGATFAGPVPHAPPAKLVAQIPVVAAVPPPRPMSSAPPANWVPQTAPLIMRDEPLAAVRPQPSLVSSAPPINWVPQTVPVVARDEAVAAVGPPPRPVSTASAAKPDVPTAAVAPRNDASELPMPPEPSPLPKFLEARASAPTDARAE
jgi:tetratricopeptide (TPR) repeat protein